MARSRRPLSASAVPPPRADEKEREGERQDRAGADAQQDQRADCGAQEHRHSRERPPALSEVGGKVEVPGARAKFGSKPENRKSFAHTRSFLSPAAFSNQFGLIPADSSAN